MTQSWHRTIASAKIIRCKTSPSISLSLSQRIFAGGVSFFVYICWLLVAAAWCCQNFLPNLYAALLAAAPLRALFLALAFALAFALANNLCRWRFFVAGCWLLLLGGALLVRCFAGRRALSSSPSLSLSLTTFAGGVSFVAGCWALLLGGA
jgi:hypothetical protein